MADDKVSLCKPKARAKLHLNTGAVSLSVPVTIGDKSRSVRLGITLLDATKGVYEDPDARRKLEQSLFEALTATIQVQHGAKDHPQSTSLHKAIADAIEPKLKDNI